MKQGDDVECSNCGKTATLETPVLELFGHEVAFGHSGHEDMWSERDGELLCKECIEEKVGTLK